MQKFHSSAISCWLGQSGEPASGADMSLLHPDLTVQRAGRGESAAHMAPIGRPDWAKAPVQGCNVLCNGNSLTLSAGFAYQLWNRDRSEGAAGRASARATGEEVE